MDLEYAFLYDQWNYIPGKQSFSQKVVQHPMDVHFWKKYKENSVNLL